MDLTQFLAEWHDDSPTLLVHTSGSTGEPKPLLVEKRRMEASAEITCRFLRLHRGGTALLCMPLDYIAGKMMVVRALTQGLRLVSVSPSSHPLQHPLPTETIDLAAMVPLQVWSTLQVAEERQRLLQIRHLLIGGGAVSDELAEALKDLPNHIWNTYGMTETLSHIALRRLKGVTRSDWYTPFDGVHVSLSDDGCLVIDAPVVHDGPLTTNDMAELKDGRFRILGRKDNVICSGGIKVQTEEVERLLHPHLPAPFMITKAPDVKLGERIVLLTESSDLPAIRQICQQQLPKYWQPRQYIHVTNLPLTETGKPARAVAQQMAKG